MKLQKMLIYNASKIHTDSCSIHLPVSC